MYSQMTVHQSSSPSFCIQPSSSTWLNTPTRMRPNFEYCLSRTISVYCLWQRYTEIPSPYTGNQLMRPHPCLCGHDVLPFCQPSTHLFYSHSFPFRTSGSPTTPWLGRHYFFVCSAKVLADLARNAKQTLCPWNASRNLKSL